MTIPLHLLSSKMVLSPDLAYLTIRNQHEDTNRRRRRESIVINLSSPLSHSTTFRSLSNLQATPFSASRSTKSLRNASQPIELLNGLDQMHPQNTLEKYLNARHLHQKHLLIDPDGVMTMLLHLLSPRWFCHQILHKHKRTLFHHSILSVVEQGRHAHIVQFSSANSTTNRVHVRVNMSKKQPNT